MILVPVIEAFILNVTGHAWLRGALKLDLCNEERPGRQGLVVDEGLDGLFFLTSC